MSLDHDIGIAPDALMCVRFLLMRKTLPVEVLNYLVRYLRSRDLMWSGVDVPPPAVIESDRQHCFVLPLRPGVVKDIALCVPNEKTDFVAQKLIAEVADGDLRLPFTNPTVQVFLRDTADDTWVSRTLNLYVSREEYTCELITDHTLDVVMRILLVVLLTSPTRSDYRLYFVNQCQSGQLSTICVDITSTGQVYLQLNASMDNLASVGKPTMLITRYCVSDADSFLTCGVCMPNDPDVILTLCVNDRETPPFAETPPLNFKCSNVRLYVIDPRICGDIAGVIRHRMWWGAVVMGQLISLSPRRRIFTIERAIRQWNGMSDVDYMAHRLLMWYVYHTVLSHTVIVFREKMKASLVADGMPYHPISNVVHGLCVTPYRAYASSHTKRDPSDYTPSVRCAGVPTDVAGIDHVRVFDYKK